MSSLEGLCLPDAACLLLSAVRGVRRKEKGAKEDEQSKGGKVKDDEMMQCRYRTGIEELVRFVRMNGG